MKTVVPTIIVVLGVVLLVASALWAIVFPPQRNWTTEKSARMTELGDQANLLKMQLAKAQTSPSMHSGKNPAEIQEEYDKIAVEYAELHQAFLSASNSPKTSASILRWSGIAFVAAGGLFVFANRGG
jgi:hypothetical protein